MTELQKLQPLIRKMRRLDNSKIEIELDLPFKKLAAHEESEITDEWSVISAKAVGVFRQGVINSTNTNLDILHHSFRHLVMACRRWPMAERKIDKIKTRPDAPHNVTLTLPSVEPGISFTVKVKVKEKAFPLSSSEAELATLCNREVELAADFIAVLAQRAQRQQ